MPDGCINWSGEIDHKGYGIIRWRVKGVFNKRLAHRWVWEGTYGYIDPNLVLHHKCENPLCVNIDHLQLMTRGEHSRFHHIGKTVTVCRKGHPLTQLNTIVHRNGERRCRICKNATNNSYGKRKRGLAIFQT